MADRGRSQTTCSGQKRAPVDGPAAPVTPAASIVHPRLKKVAPVLLIAAFTFIFFAPFFVQGKIFLAADTLYLLHPWKAHAPAGFQVHNDLITDPVNMNWAFVWNFSRELKQGHVGSWDPAILGGIPVFGGRSYPLALLMHGLFDPATAMTLMIAVHMFLMGWFMHRYLSEIGAGARGAVFGAVAYMFNGCAMVWLSYETVIPCAAYVPLLLLIMERLGGPRRLAWALLGALVMGVVCLLGHVQYLLYTSLILVSYLAFLLVRLGARKAPAAEVAWLVGCFAILTGGGALIGLVEILPALEAIGSSSRAARTFDFAGLFDTMGRVPLRSYVTLVFPDFFGSPPLGVYGFAGRRLQYTNYNELCLYAGVPTLFAIAALAVRPKAAHARFFLVLAVLLVAMMAGAFFFWPLFAWYPGMSKLNPMRMIFILVFALSAAAGLGVKTLEDLSPRRRTTFVVLVLSLLALIAAFAFAAARSPMMDFFNGDQAGTKADLRASLEPLRAVTSPVMYRPLLLAAAAGALFIASVFVRGRRAAAIVFAATTGLLGFDLIGFGWGYNTRVDREQIYAATPSIEFLQAQPGPFRVVQDAGKGMGVNTMAPFGIQEIGGYQSVYSERLNKLASYIEYGPKALHGKSLDRWVMFKNVRHPFFDFLNVRYVLTAPGVPVPSGGQYRMAFSGDMNIFENTRALARAYAVHRARVLTDPADIVSALAAPDFDPRREVILEHEPPEAFARAAAGAAAPPSVTLTAYQDEEVRISADLSAPGWVVLADVDNPGWVATIDEQEAPILRANCALRAVAVPEGKHEIVYRYRPAPLRRGRVISLVSAAVLLGGLVLAWRRTRVAPEPSAS